MKYKGNCYVSGAFLQRKRDLFGSADGLPSERVTTIAFDGNGTLWAGTAAGLARFDGKCFLGVPLLDKELAEITLLFCSRDGVLYAASGSALFRVTENEASPEADFGGARIVDMAENEGNLYVLTEQAIMVNKGGWELFNSTPARAQKLVMEAGMVYVLGENALYALEGKRPSWKSMMPSLLNIPVSTMHTIRMDAAGHLWLGTADGVFIYDNTDYWIGPAEIETLPAESIYDITFGSDGTVYFGSDNGVIILDKGALKYLGAKRWVPHTQVLCTVVNNEDGTIWAATSQGLSRISSVRMTLSEKAAYYQKQTETYNLRDCFAGDLEDIRNGDMSTGSIHISDNDGLWTGYNAAAQIYRYAVTRDENARILARRMIDGLLWLTRVTELPGFTARAIRRPGEKGFGDGDKEWHLTSDGVCEWKCETSSDEMVGHFLAFSLYYDLCADKAEKKEIAAAVCAIVDHILRNNYRLVDKDGLPTTWGTWAPEQLNHDLKWNWEKGVNSVEILAILKVAQHMSDNTAYADAYRELISKHHYALNIADYKRFDAHLWHNDDCLSLLSMITLLNYESDKTVRALCFMGLERHWQYEKIERTQLWNFIYGAYTGRYCDVDAAVQTLKDIPLDLVDYEIINSTRKKLVYDTEQEQWGAPRQLKTPLPADERSVGRPDNNHFCVDSGKGTIAENASFWLLPYWFARYHKLIAE